MGGRKQEGDSFPVEPIFPEAEPYPSIRALPKPIRVPNHRPDTLTGLVKVQIDAYVRDALRATGTEQPTPLPRRRAARSSDVPPLEPRPMTPVEYDLEDEPTGTFTGGPKP